MKKILAIALVLSSVLPNTSLASNPEHKAFIEEVARISVLDWAATSETRSELISNVLGDGYIEMFHGLSKESAITSEHVVASFLTHLNEKPNQDLKQLLHDVIQTSRNKYTYVIEDFAVNRKQNIIEFNEECTVVFKDALVKATVIDLRGNTGGSLNCALKVSEKLLPNGYSTTATFHSNLGNETIRIRGENRVDLLKKTRKVIVDEETASAAEFLTFVLEGAGWEIVFGNNSKHTYGKNWTQSKHRFNDLTYVLTTGYFTVGECHIEGCRLNKSTPNLN